MAYRKEPPKLNSGKAATTRWRGASPFYLTQYLATEGMNAMNDFVIDKGIPLPAGRDRQKYPFHLMDVGDSFMVSLELVTAVRMAIQRFRQINGEAKFATRRDGSGMRVFRVA
jgi:hypothetical protein